MLIPMDHPAQVKLLSAAGDLHMPFSDAIKYCILGISVTLLLLALAILGWQTFRCCTQTHTAYTEQDTLKSDLLYSDEKSDTGGNYSGAPSMKVENVNTEVRRLSRCLSQGSLSSPEYKQTAGETGEKASLKTVPGGQVSGSLCFSVYYDQLQARLVVTILQVDGLVKKSETRSLQLFVRIRLMRAGLDGVEVEDCTDEQGEETPPIMWTVLSEWQTRIVKGSCNPLFGDQFSCVLQDDKELQRITLRMEVRDFDKFSRHLVLGEVRVSLRQLSICYPLELHEDLQIPQKDLVGQVLLSLKFLPTSQRLEVGLLKVRTGLNNRRSDAALFARIGVQCNQCKLRYQKTSAVALCLVTVFNEVVIFSLPELPLEQCKILVSVYETSKAKKSTKFLIGQLSVGREKTFEDKHWSLMMQSVRQPIAKWHGLLI
ncbi:synaptotagmin-1 [Betta splendens]|uniref:Synaptotagmin-1 n=1 Tax=Betta splendens TaxID=158456 RepID=A0A9W2XV60_BETSP|nr:synaptotagmin-1 [Betta splendens]XP_055365480.1 synaptotagmin-1 [Betta splendens]